MWLPLAGKGRSPHQGSLFGEAVNGPGSSTLHGSASCRPEVKAAGLEGGKRQPQAPIRPADGNGACGDYSWSAPELSTVRGHLIPEPLYTTRRRPELPARYAADSVLCRGEGARLLFGSRNHVRLEWVVGTPCKGSGGCCASSMYQEERLPDTSVWPPSS